MKGSCYDVKSAASLGATCVKQKKTHSFPSGTTSDASEVWSFIWPQPGWPRYSQEISRNVKNLWVLLKFLCTHLLQDVCIYIYTYTHTYIYMCDGQNSIHVVRSWHRFIRPPIATHSPSTLFTN